MVRARGHVEEQAVAALLGAGYTTEAALEAITQVAYTTMANLVANVAGTPVDDAFAPQAWEAVAALPGGPSTASDWFAYRRSP